MNPEQRSKLFPFAIVALVAVVIIFGIIRLQNKNGPAKEQVSELNLFAMSDYFPEEVLREFEQKYNAKIRYDNFSNNEELLAKLQAGASGYDVIVPSDYMVTALMANHLLLPLDFSRIPNVKNLGEEFRHLPYDEKGEYSVPYMWGTTGIAYNSKFVKNPQESWDLLFKAEYKGRISVLEDAREAMGIAMRKLGYSGNSTAKEQIQKAQEIFSGLKPSIRIFTSDPKQHLASEDVWIAQVYSGDAMISAKTKPEIKYFVPKEGATLWIDNLAIPSGARNQFVAHEFINFILEPRIAKILTEKIVFSSPNFAAENLISDENLKASHIKKVRSSKVEFLKDLGSGMQLWDDAWIKAKN